MSSFKVYLPSNVSSTRFPNNTSSNFHTELQHPMQLDGNWEVGLESIFYSSELGSMKEKGHLHLSLKSEKKVKTYEDLPFRFRLSKEQTWLGYDGVLVKQPQNPNLKQVIDALNSANDLILEGGRKLFQFYLRPGMLKYKTFLPNFHIRLSHRINALLGILPHELSSNIRHRTIPPNAEQKLKELTVSDFKVHYFYPDILEQESVHYLDIHEKEVKDLTKYLNDFWQTQIFPRSHVKIEISNSNKVILHHFGKQKGIALSLDLQYLMSQRGHLFARDSRWSHLALTENPITPRGVFSVTIYTDKMKEELRPHYDSIHLSFQPRMFDKVKDIIAFLNRIANAEIKTKLGREYHGKLHRFYFSEFNNRVKLTAGRWIHTRLDDNLCYILGFKDNVFKDGKHEGVRMPSTLQEREQLFYVEADFVQAAPFGIQQLPILREFIHDVTDESKIIEKRFHPVSFIPVSKSNITQMHISIVDQRGKPVVMKNVKTVLCLHFQRMQ